ncbi:MAG TPA: paraquat-inducible protein A [Xanthobacteraceae bacterium]
MSKPVNDRAADAGPVVICHDCDAVYKPFELGEGEAAHCIVCHAQLARHSRLGSAEYLALTLAASIFFLIANIAPVLSITINGMHTTVNVWQAALSMRETAVEPAAVALAVTTCIVPLAQLSLLLWILVPTMLARSVPGLAHALVALHLLRPWGMAEVFFLGALVVIVKLAGFMPISSGPGLWTLGAFTLLLAILSRFETRTFWAKIERGSA